MLSGRKCIAVLKVACGFRWLLLSIWILLSGAGHLPAQGREEYLVEIQKYRAADGLSNNHVYQIYQDSRGLVWIVTGSGVDVFDGTMFSSVLKWPVIQNRLAIKICLEDRRGNLWIRMEEQGGQYRFQQLDMGSRMSRYGEDGLLCKIDSLADVALDAQGRFWFLSQSGTIWRERKDGGYKKLAEGYAGFEFAQGKFQNSLVWLHDKRRNPGLAVQLLALDTAGRVKVKKMLRHPVQYAFFREIRGGAMLHIDAQNITWIKDTGAEKLLPLTPMRGNQADVVGEFWIHEHPKGGGKLYLQRSGYLTILTYGENWEWQGVYEVSQSQYCDLSAMNIMLDRQSNLWIGGLDGISRIALIPNRFTKYNQVEPTVKSAYLSNSSRAITGGKDGSLYLMSGPVVYRKKSGAQTLDSIMTCRAIAGMAVEGSSGAVYLKYNGLIRYDPKEGGIRYIPPPEKISPTGFAWSLFDAGNTLWVGDEEGLWTYEASMNRTSVFESYNGFDELRYAEKYHMARKNREEFFVLTNKGLYIVDEKKGVITCYGNRFKGLHYLPAEIFYHISQDESGDYWVATSNGLIHWDISNNHFAHYTTQNGFPTNNILAVYPDTYGTLWMNTDNGIVRFSPKTNTCRIFFERDGIAHNEGNRISHYKAPDGTLYFGGLNGVNAFHPRDFNDFFRKPKKLAIVLMEAFKYDVQSSQRYNILPQFVEEGRLALLPRDNILNIRVAVPDVPSGEQLRYSFRLNNFGAGWIPAQKGYIRLINLPYGRTFLEVRAKSLSGAFTSMLRIPVEVKRPFYLQWWFRLLMLLLSVVLVYLWTYYRLQSLLRQRSELEKEVARRTQKIQEDKELIERQALDLKGINEEKSHFFANVTHEFRTPLSLILGPVQALRDRSRPQTQDRHLLDIALRNAGQLLTLVDDILMLSVLETRHFRVEGSILSPHNLVHALVREYEEIAIQKGVALYLDSHLEPTYYLCTDRRILRIILNNLLSNAFKFTPPGGRIDVRLDQKDLNLSIVVQDTGRGIHSNDLPHIFERFFQTRQPGAAAEGGTGIGLALSAELSDLLGGNLSVHSQYGQGATFTFSLPWQPLQDLPAHTLKDTRHVLPDEDLEVSKKSDTLILIVEDNPDMQQYISLLLADYYLLATASNGKEALRLIEQEGVTPNLIISDFMMPEMDGLQLLVTLRKEQPITRFIPFVMLTARVEQEDRQAALLVGVDDYLIKPFDAKMLLTVVSKLVNRYQERIKGAVIAEDHKDDSEKVKHKQEKKWLDKLQRETLQLMGKETFSIDRLAEVMLMGRTNFYNEVKRLTGLTPNQYVLEARLVRARHLLEREPDMSVRLVVQTVGLRDERYFVKMFKKRFGQLPSYYR